MSKFVIVKVVPPHPKTRGGRFFVKNRTMTFTYRGKVPPYVVRAVNQSPAKKAFFRIEEVGNGEIRFIEQMEDQGW